MTDETAENRRSWLVRIVEEKLPGFVDACNADLDVIVLHQDAFAADYQDADCTLFGMAIKYAGLRGKEVRIIAAKTRSTH